MSERSDANTFEIHGELTTDELRLLEHLMESDQGVCRGSEIRDSLGMTDKQIAVALASLISVGFILPNSIN